VISEDAGNSLAATDNPKGDAEGINEPETTGVAESVIQLIGDAHDNPPQGFSVHGKLQGC